jgi:hypothetical protein
MNRWTYPPLNAPTGLRIGRAAEWTCRNWVEVRNLLDVVDGRLRRGRVAGLERRRAAGFISLEAMGMMV